MTMTEQSPTKVTEQVPTKATEQVPAKVNEVCRRRPGPLDAFDFLQEEVARLFGRTWPASLSAASKSAWLPRLDLFDRGNELVAKVELPGVKREDIDVSIVGGDLVIAGERHEEREVKEEQYHRLERSFGSFYRRLPVPFEVRPDQIKASFADGVLEVCVPRPPETPPNRQRIPIA